MFTGIIETLGTVRAIGYEGGNVYIIIHSSLTSELKIDQSLAHNGVCLTVVGVQGSEYKVVAIQETLQKSNLGSLKKGDRINLERCLLVGSRLDGHMVQGHVDEVGMCTEVISLEGSWEFNIEMDPLSPNFTVEKGSICINGTSLTVINSGKHSFTVAIIPYTYENTNFHLLKKGDRVNLEFDILGKYIAKIMERQNGKAPV